MFGRSRKLGMKTSFGLVCATKKTTLSHFSYFLPTFFEPLSKYLRDFFEPLAHRITEISQKKLVCIFERELLAFENMLKKVLALRN